MSTDEHPGTQLFNALLSYSGCEQLKSGKLLIGIEHAAASLMRGYHIVAARIKVGA